ncbi:putative Ig domain-containing protein [Venenivibrio stagnispumantis]|uniref:Prepilin-type N-terminal cleavage/methylation domain-containing protein n=1 Tax=Venenivibrio stagnispumantis TaxID=407998 RepID=A0AA46ACQ9_9AQUI|nr:putative Ig domain-containing protein [Venenivibrio stagnispumantis]MCW4572615.1 putative Ig domain-containing protein [Venenivibrio stagnispumantis]SMP00589.1 prepilin-type N-terminal cleavage/methylation domain-containing protein [Venenivibrio stagnispumantis]
MKREYPFSKAFTLIEMAIVLVIIGMLLVMGISLFGVLTKRAKNEETKDNIKSAVETIIGYTAYKEKLPLSQTDSSCPTSSDCFQKVVNIKDAYGKDFLYIVPSNPDNPDLTQNKICDQNITNLTVRKCNDINCNNYDDIQNIAFVIVSGGENHNIQTNKDNSGVVKIYVPGTPNIDDYPTDINRLEDYDDIASWVTLNELKVKIGCVYQRESGKGPLRIITDYIPTGKQGESYNAIITADGGEPFNSGGKYKWISSGLATGLSPNPTNGNQSDYLTISGTPSCPGNYNVAVSVTDSKNTSVSKNFALTIYPNYTLSPMNGYTWTAVKGQNFNANIQVKASGLSNSFTSSCNPNSCNGLSCLANNDIITISGTPNVAGTCDFGVTFIDDTCSSYTINANYSVVISESVAGGGGGSGGGSGGGGGNLNPPSCSLTASQNIINSGNFANITANISNGPANGSFNPQTGTCTSFNNVSNSWNCNTANLTSNTNLNLTVTNAVGSGTCNIKICVIKYNQYRIFNNTGARIDYKIGNGNCNRVNNNRSVNISSGQTVYFYSSNNRSCQNQIGYVDFSWAVCTDDDGDRQINFNSDGTTSDR